MQRSAPVAASTAVAQVPPPMLAAGITGLAILLGVVAGWRIGALFLVGAALGHSLYHAAFGFTSAYRILIAERRTAGLRAQMLMLALACVIFFPVIAGGSVFGTPVHGEVAAVGVAVVVGAFIFGLGMQLASGCASGTLYTVGGGNGRMVVVLAAFIGGSVLGAAHLPWWKALPSLPLVSLARSGSWLPGLALSLALFAAIAAGSAWLERRRYGSITAIGSRVEPGEVARHLVRGPWPFAWGAVALALLNIATLVLAGRPWGITSGFALWGAKLLAAAGVDVASWPYWQEPAHATALLRPVFLDITSVMDVGIILGATGAALLAGRFRPSFGMTARSGVAAIVGGLLLGYGARLASGCNIGAYFSGIASGSLHGWVWLVAALLGNGLGVWLRPWFDLGRAAPPSPRRG